MTGDVIVVRAAGGLQFEIPLVEVAAGHVEWLDQVDTQRYLAKRALRASRAAPVRRMPDGASALPLILA